jgi:hypothetical protein
MGMKSIVGMICWVLWASPGIHSTNAQSNAVSENIRDEVAKIDATPLTKYRAHFANGRTASEWVVIERHPDHYDENPLWIYTDDGGNVRKLISRMSTEYEYVDLICYYGAQGELLHLLTTQSATDEEDLTDSWHITGGVYKNGDAFSEDFIFSTPEGGDDYGDKYPEIKFPFLGEINLSPYLSIDVLKAYLNFDPALSDRDSRLHFHFEPPQKGEWSSMNANRIPLMEEPNRCSTQVDSYHVGYPVDVVDIESHDHASWYKVRSQIDGTVGYVESKFLTPVEQIITE